MTDVILTRAEGRWTAYRPTWWARAQAAFAAWRLEATKRAFKSAHGYCGVDASVEAARRALVCTELSNVASKRLMRIAELTTERDSARREREEMGRTLARADEALARCRNARGVLTRLLGKRAGRDELRPSEWNALRAAALSADFIKVRPGTGKARDAARARKAAYRKTTAIAAADRKRRTLGTLAKGAKGKGRRAVKALLGRRS